MSLIRISKEHGKLVEEAAPAFLVTCAGLFVGQVLVGQGELGSAVERLKPERHQRLSFRRPGQVPGEDERLLGNHLLIDPGRVVLVAVEQPEHYA